ncbi:MAG: FtsK/SpoIIIE domain-containing protein [Actinomycetota bacterium]|nr:FtsK/SpoIIIE domain-containing protein [Actinomycetota bacterium]
METTPTPGWQCTWRTGPDAGASQTVTTGRHLLGRARTAALRCDDPALQPHHALVEVDARGALLLTQLTGRTPMTIAGEAIDGTTRIGAEAVVEVGGSTLVLEPAITLRLPTPTEAANGTPGRAGASAIVGPGATTGATVQVHDGAVVRSPRAVPQWRPSAVVAPPGPVERAEATGGLLPAVLGLAGAGAIAAVLRQPMFLLFGGLGALVAIGSWAAQRVAARRRFARDLAEHDRLQAVHAAAVMRERMRAREHQLATVPTIASAVHTISTRSTALWGRRADHPDAHLVGLGVGSLPWPGDGRRTGADHVDHDHDHGDHHDHEHHPDHGGYGDHDHGPGPDASPEGDLPVAGDLGPGSRLALRGPQAAAVARSLLLQLAASCGPADVRMVVVTDRPAAWDCLRSLPHLTAPDGTAAIVGEGGLTALLGELHEHAGHLVLVTDQPALLAARTSPVRRALADPDRHALLLMLPADHGVPHLCTAVLSTTHGPFARWVADTRTTLLPVQVRVAGTGERVAFACAAALRGLLDPEDPLSVAGRVPRSVALSQLLANRAAGHSGASAAEIAAAWQANGDDPPPRAVIGVAADGVVDIDLVRDGPHGLIAGTTGAGKSELLRTLVAAMAATSGPAHLSFVLVDYKGGATFDACSALPHVVGLVTDLDDELADRALRSLHAELRRREALLREHEVADMTALRTVAPHVLLPRLVVVIDEFAALVAEQPAFLHALVGVAQRGRSLGVHLLLATQRPNGVISDDIRANTNLRLALRLQDTADAIDVVGIAAPALLPRGAPGRAVMRLGADDHLTFQTAQCTGSAGSGPGAGGPGAGGCGESELQVLVRSIVEAARLVGAPQPPAPWQPALPASLPRDVVPACAVGVADDPDHQRVLPLRWAPADGHLLLAGSTGAGVSSTLHTLAVHALTAPHTAGDPDGCSPDVYVLDARGDDMYLPLTIHPRCGAVVHIHERERVLRLLHRLRALTRDPSPAAARGAQVVLVIDGLDAARRTLDDLATAGEYEALEEVLVHGAAAGIVVVAGVEQAAAVPAAFLARCAHRWVLHLHDPHDAGLLGVPAARVPRAGVPGRLVVAGDGLLAQMVQPAAMQADAGRRPHVQWPADQPATDQPTTDQPATDQPAARRPAADRPAAQRIDELPALVPLHALATPPGDHWAPAPRPGDGRCHDGIIRLPLGLDFATGHTLELELPDGEQVLVVGGPRSGRSGALARLTAAWRAAHPDGWVAAVLPRRSAFPAALADLVLPELQSRMAPPHADVAEPVPAPTPTPAQAQVQAQAATGHLLDHVPAHRPVLLVIDDAEGVDDPGGHLSALAAGARPQCWLFVAGRPDALRQAYGHWTSVVRRSRCGLVATGGSELDGDLLGASLPRRTPVPARPGLMWLVSNGATHLVQVAVDPAAPTDPAGGRPPGCLATAGGQ